MRKNVLGKAAKKRGLTLILTCSAALALMVPASAHGHSGGHHRETRPLEDHVQLCEVEDCRLIGQHEHDGVTYCGNPHDEGYCAGKCEINTTFAVRRHGNTHQRTHGRHH